MKGNNSPVVHRLFAGNSLRNFNYLIETSSACIAIDPYDATQVSQMIDDCGKALTTIINTHEHHDHIRGNQELVNKYQAKVYAHKNAQGMIPGVDQYLSQGERVELGDGYYLQVMDTPGHTHAHLCFLLCDSNKAIAVFTGDTLFNAGVGNCHNGGDPEVLYETIRQQFLNLADEIIVYPGHDYMRSNLAFTLDREPSNVQASEMLTKHKSIDHNQEFWLTKMGEEKRINTFLRLDNLEIIKNLPKKTNNQKEVFLTLRELRNKW